MTDTRSDTPAPSPPRRRRPLLVLAVVVGVLAVAVAVALAFTLLSDDSTADAAVRLEPADHEGEDPFTDSVAIGPVVEFPGNVQAVNASVRDGLTVDDATATLVAEGTTPGLYGGSGDRAVCDPVKLVKFLEDEPAKAAAWAAVLGIDRGAIETYVGALTPVVLSSDTLVTNHGFSGGRATAFTAVLQAGTAVLVDSTGVPRVKCNCGNPLAEPPSRSLDSALTSGDGWEGFTAEQVVAVHPGTATGTLTVTDVVTGEPTEVSVGASGAWVAAVPSGEDTRLYRSPDGSEWQRAGLVAGEQVNGLTWDGERWLAIARNLDGTTVLVGTDLSEWTEVASIPAVIEDVDWSDGRFVAVGSEGQDSSAPVIYTSADAASWNKATSGSLDGEASMITDVAHGPGGWLALAVSGIEDDAASMTLLTAAGDASNWRASAWSKPILWGFDGARATVAGSNDDVIVAGEPAGSDAVGLHVGPDVDSLEEVPGSPFEDSPPDGMAWGAPGGLAYTWGVYEPGDPVTSTFLAGTDGRTWGTVGELDGQVLALGWGPVESAAAESTDTTTSASESTDLRSVDWGNRSYELGDCPTGGVEAALRDGNWTSPDGAQGVRLSGVQYGDLTGDGDDEAVPTFECYPVGGNAYPIVVSLVYTPGDGDPDALGRAITGASPTIVEDSLRTSDPVWAEGDPRCCPSGTDEKTWRYHDGAWVPS